MVLNQYKEFFKSMIDIADAICNQLFEKVDTIPYSIRQFCKALYQAAKDKFTTPLDNTYIDKEIIKLIATFLLEKWVLNSIFLYPHQEGLIKEFYLSSYCKKNLNLLSHIVLCTFTVQEWEVETPLKEKLFDLDQPDLFKLPEKLKTDLTEGVQTFYRGFL